MNNYNDALYKINNNYDVIRAVFQCFAFNFFISIFYVTPLFIKLFGLNIITIYIIIFCFCVHFALIIPSLLFLFFEISDFYGKRYKQHSLKSYLS